MENTASHPGISSSASDKNTFNSAGCDAGAQDMFRDSLSLNELRNAYPELYQFICQTDPTFGATDLEEVKEVSRSKLGKGLKDQDFDHGFDVSQLLKESNSVTSLLTIRKAMSSIFESLNTVHVQKTLKLRLEIRDLCCRLQSLQTSRETDQREIYRLQRENDRCRRELAHQASRYEDRITELHGVLEELKRKASEMQNSNSTNNATVDVNDLVEVSDSDGETDAPDAEAACTLSEFSAPESVLHPSIGQEDRSEPLARQTIVQEPWMAGSVRTVSSVQSDTAAAARRPDLTSPATSASNILTEVRTQGKPVMGLRQHIQTRKPRILSQAQLSQSCSGVGVNGNRLQRDSTQSPQISQPISEFSLNFEAAEQAGRLSKASFACDDRVGQPHLSAWSDSTSSVPHSCRSGDNNRGSETATAALGGTGGDEAEPQWVRYCVSCCLGVTDTGGGGGNSPSVGVAQTLLTGLAGAAPYPRLADVARCSLLACEQREALCARQDAEIAVLEASLAEAKATGNQLRCRLSQIEASWGAANRAAELADMALETSGVLVHLYSSELALLLHKQPHTERRPKSRKSLQDRSFGRHSLSRSAFTSSSTSTSSSSSSCSSSSEDKPQRSCKAPSASVVPASCHHVASVKNSIGRQIQPPAATSDSGSNVYALYAMNEKSSDEASHLSIPTWIPPHAVCSGPACLRLLKMQRHQIELTALHLLGRFASTSEPFLKPESLNCTIAEDFDHSTTNGNRSTATGTESGLGAESGGSSSGMGAHGVYANAWGIATRPAASTRHAFKSGGGGDCGWQTPDSGADSFSTNDHTASTTATKATASLAVIAGVPNTHTCASCSSNSSSSSAAAGAVVINSGVGAGVSDAAAVLHDVGVWTRVKEMRLRHILDQIIWERMLVRSTIAVGVNNLEAGCSGVPQGGESHYVKPYTGSEIPAYSEGGPMGMTTQDSRDPAISNRLNALFMVDTAALMQDLCAVKEDRAKLKVQNYIMEKELRAIQLSHQRHCLLESTLRSQLNALQIDRNLQMLKASDCSDIPNPLAQQIESMQSAFESLRKGAELHQTQSEELVNDLKQANAALITAFEKAKSKYLARIRKLERQIVAPSSTPMVSRPASSTAFAPTKHTISTQPPMVPAHKTAHPEPPLLPLSPSPVSDVYEVIQDSHVGPVTIRKNPGQPLLNATTSGDATSQNSCYSLVQGAPFYPNQPMPTINRAPPRAR